MKPPKNLLTIFTSEPLKCNGFIQSWEYFSTATENFVTVYLAIWRPRGLSQYELVDFNLVKPKKIGRNFYKVPENEQISVKSGDVIGIHYSRDSRKGAIPMYEPGYGPFANSDLSDIVQGPIFHETIEAERIVSAHPSLRKTNAYLPLAKATIRQGNKPALLLPCTNPSFILVTTLHFFVFTHFNFF